MTAGQSNVESNSQLKIGKPTQNYVYKKFIRKCNLKIRENINNREANRKMRLMLK